MEEWKIVGTLVCEGEPLALGGLDPWRYQWRQLDQLTIAVPHPSYPQQRHQVRVYEIADGHTVVKFAAAEFSNGVWGFFLPAEDSRAE